MEFSNQSTKYNTKKHSYMSSPILYLPETMKRSIKTDKVVKKN